MGLFDTILGRTKPVKANLDALFALPSAGVTLESSCGVVSTGNAGVCFKPPAGQNFADMQTELEKLLELGDPGPNTTGTDGAAAPAPVPAATLSVRHVGDRFGYRWILLEGGNLDDLVTRVHMVHSSLEDAGWSAQLLCSVFGFAPQAGGDPAVATEAVDRPVYLVYLAKQGTFYPFAPSGDEHRDTELEMRLRGVLGTDLPVEADLSRWFPLWDLPVA
ncbi:MAG: PspA-associated protein PspAB [Acidimicrobiales bacterium]